MITCVNPNLKEFKDCCKRLNVSPATLEPIVHKYINIEGNENSFPSDAYISERIHGREVSVLSDAQIKVWDRKFSEPKTFNSSEEAVAYYNEARKYFPKEAIGFKETRNGKYEVRVAEPFNSNELEDIKKKAIADGTFMKAPNGQPTNLTEQQWLQVRTKAFKRWFGDWENDPENASKVVDENGEPLVVYHSSKHQFDTYHPSLSEYGFGSGMFFSNSIKYSNLVAQAPLKDKVFLNIRNPKHINNIEKEKTAYIFLEQEPVQIEDWVDKFNTDEGYDIYVNETIKQQNDGIIGQDADKPAKYNDTIEYVVKNPNQIKSATDNIGTYSLEDDNIYHENEATNYTATRDSRLEALREQEEVSIVDLLNLIDSNSEYASIIDLLKTKKQRGKTPLLKGIKVKIVNSAITPDSYDVKKLETSRGQYRRAYYDASSKTIIINSNGLFNGGRADSVILHEVIHAITVNRIKDNKEFRAEFDSIIEKYLEDFPHLKYRYGKDNNSHYMEEFIADIWSNTQTIEHLKSIKSDKKLTLWDKIRNFFIKLFAGSDGTLMADASDALYRLLDELETDTSKDTFYEGELIASSAKASKFARQLTNPGNNLTVEYRGTTFRNAEHAYQTWKSGEFDEVAYKSTAFKPVGSKKVNKVVNFDIMVEIITAKLQQHPELIQGITDRGGLDYIRNSTHAVTGDKYWESSGENKFIEALAKAYENVISSFLSQKQEIDTLKQDLGGREEAKESLSSAKATRKQRRTYTGTISSLEDNQIFVFGSNPEGRHGAGAAKAAKDKFGAIYGQGEGMQGQSYALPTKRIRSMQPSYKGKMTFSYGENKRSDVQSSSTFEAIINGERTATTRYASDGNIDYWMTVKAGDIVAFTSSGGKGTVYVRITKPLTKLTEDTSVEEWSKKEGWSTEYYESKVKSKVLAGEAYQMEYEFVDAYGERTITPKEIRENIKRMYEVARNNPDKEFIVAYSKDGKNLNGYTSEEMAEMFASEPIPSNIVFEEGFNSLVSKYESSNGVIETQETLPSKEYFEAKVKEIQEALGCDEETARGLAEMYDDNSTEEDLKSSEEQLAELDAIFKDSLNVGEQIEALIDSEDITKSEIITIAYDIAYTISDLITTWHENPKELITKFGKPSKDIDKIKSMTRAEVVEYIGVSNLFDYVKEFYFGKVTDPNLMDKADVLYENFDAVIKFGTSAFASVEDFALTYSEVGYTVSDKSIDDSDSELAKDIEEASESGDKQEHWQIDSRTIDNFLSMSQIVKRELVRLYLVDELVDENGTTTTKVRTNAFGMKKRVDPKDATNSILRWTRGALTLPEMVARLKEKQNSDPWIKPLISKLEDSKGEYTDFQSQFFTVFCKHFQEYYIVTEERQKDGTTINKVIPVNVNPALKEVMDSIKLLYELHAHPLFDSKGVKKDKLDELTKYVELLDTLVNESTPNVERIKNGIVKISELLGFKVDNATVELAINPTMLQDTMTNLRYIVKNLTAGAKQENYNPFEFKKGGSSIGTNLRNFLKPLTDRMEDVAIGAFYDSGKMYQSEVLPSWLSKTMDKFLTLDGKEYEEFLMKEYGQYEWFRNTKETDIKKGWRNTWLQRLAKATLAERKEMFGHHVQLNYLGHNYMRNMSSPEYVLATLGEFFNDTTSDKEAIGYSYYKIPMMSNKPSLEFIKFIRYKGLNYEDSIVNGLFNVFVQELMRIQTVLKRGYKKGDPQFIVPFDARGKHFLFLDYLDVYLNGSEKDSQLGILLNKKVRGEELPDVVIDGETMSGEDGLKRLVKGVIKSEMDAKAGKIITDYKAKGIFEAAKKISGVGKSDAEVEANLRNFVWNDTFAAINILQMTITDLAYYKNTEDVQKRLAQIHAPGMKGNINATDYNGERVCDGSMRAVFLADYEGDAVVQNIVENLEIVFDRKIESAKTDAERDYWESTKEAIIDGIKTSVNVADAQAYNCPTSYRKKALMFGKWSKEFEEAYEKLKKGEATIHDVEIAFQPLKPFVYTSTTKESGVKGAPIQKMKVGMQFKNSEYLLILADAILQGEDTGKPNILRAIFEVMEESAEKNPTKGIDTFMFASAVKAGLHGRIDLKDFLEGGDAKTYIKKLIEDTTSKDGYNATYVHTYPAEDYIIQQEVPKHFLDHSQAHGSQERYIIPSDLQETYDDGTLVYYEYRDGDKIIRKTAREFKEEYESTIAENIQDSIDNLFEELGLNFTGPDAPRLRNIALSKILQKEILSSPRYGVDLYIACSVNSDGEFKVPLGDPIQSKRVEQLINSIIKNRINKQKIAGGPVVQVSNFGMSKRLSIKFKDKEGNILPTFTEWSNKEENKGKTIDDFKEELKEKQAGVAHYECYAPAYMQEIFECFMDEKGNIDVKAMEEANPELLEMIGYRIPSEDLYSVAPLKIVGFLPKEAGEGLMLPYEIVFFTGSDFDKHHC